MLFWDSPKIIWQTEVRSYKPQEQKAQAGSPALYMDMARSLPSRANTPSSTSVSNINYMSKVPYRKTN